MADDAQRQRLAVFVFKLNESAKEDLAGIGGQAVDHLQLVQALGQITDPRDDAVQLFLVIRIKEPLPSNTISKVFFIDD